MKLKELCKIKHGFAFKGKDIIKNYSTKYVLVTPGNFNIGGGFKKDKCKYFSENGNIPKDYILRENDLIVTMTDLSVKSDTLGYSALIPKDNNIYLHNQRIGLVHDIDESKVLKDYLYWFMRTKKYQQEVVASQSGTAIHHTSPDRILNIEIDLPSIDNQRKIVKILSDVEHKIKNNNDTNNNLYELAIKYLNEMQSDEEVTLSNFGKIQGGYAFKSKDLLDTKTNNRIIKIKNLRNEISADVINSQFVENEVIDKLDNKFKIKKGNVAIAMTGAELGKTGFIYGFDDCYLNQRVGLVRGITKEKELYLNILLLSQEFQDLLNSKGYGSAQPNVSTTDIENITIQNIEDDDLMKFYEKVSPIYKKIILNCEENLNLEQLRDTLLPKLMNGEIDLYNIEI